MARTPKPYSRRQERFGRAFTKYMARFNTWLYRVSKGRFGNRFPGGAPICLLATKGRKSGVTRTTPLLFLADGDNVVVVASQGGMPKHPEWYLNLVADPNVSVQIRDEDRAMTARTADASEKQELWPRLTAMYKGYDTYQARTTRDIPVVICTPRT